jgi:hypothetical protein
MHELAAVIVDTRRLSLYQVITEHLFYLPKYTKLYVFSSEGNRHLQEMLNCEFHVVEINDIRGYNKLLKSKNFWNKIKEENILIFQEDSRLLREGIEDFYEYDYVGAAWDFYPFVGNGGLSFRHKSAMLKVLEVCNPENDINEDVYFAWGCNVLKLNLAPVHVANKFSCETQFNLGTLGYHAIEKYLSLEQVNEIKKQYESIIN